LVGASESKLVVPFRNDDPDSGTLRKIVETLWLPSLLALLVLVLTLFCLGYLPNPPVAVPIVSGELIGPEQVVFDTRNACEQIDIPDAPARAFRDQDGTVHLIATHYVARAMIGPSLDQLRRDCHVIYRSPQDSNPGHFQDNNWLYSFYTTDGRQVAALVHSEYDADQIPGMCATPKDPNNCWWNTITFAHSFNGGYSFDVPEPPQNLVAALPYRYTVGNRAGAYGYSEPTNIVRVGTFYYALINEWPYMAQKGGACLIRTSDLFNSRSWRAWDGKEFNVRFANPYRETIANPEEHVCTPVLSGEADSLLQHTKTGNFVVTQFVHDDGIYILVSHDLIHWSNSSLLVKLRHLSGPDGLRNWTYGYVSMLDPSSTDQNFSTISDTPYVYFVRMDPLHGRILLRRQIKLHFGR
jgi:hypothetical protein